MKTMSDFLKTMLMVRIPYAILVLPDAACSGSCQMNPVYRQTQRRERLSMATLRDSAPDFAHLVGSQLGLGWRYRLEESIEV